MGFLTFKLRLTAKDTSVFCCIHLGSGCRTFALNDFASHDKPRRYNLTQFRFVFTLRITDTQLITSAKEVVFNHVCLSVCLFVCLFIGLLATSRRS